MVRMKFYLVFLVAILLSAFVIVTVSSDQTRRAVVVEKAEVANARPAATAALALSRTWLKESSEGLPKSVLPAYLKTLKDYRSKLEELELELYGDQELKDAHDFEAQKAREDIVEGKPELVQGFVDTLVGNIEKDPGPGFWKNHSKEKFVKNAARSFIQCGAFAVNNCMFKFTYEPLNEWLDARRDAGDSAAQQVDLLLVVDDEGTGRADSSDEKWSDAQDFAKGLPVLNRALFQGVSEIDMFYRKRTQKTYLAVGVPMRHAGARVGAVLIGLELDEVFAKQVREATRMESLVVYGDRVVAATVENADLVQGVKRAIANQAHAHVGHQGDYAFVIMPLAQSGSDTPVHLALARKVSTVGAGFDTVRNLTLLVLVVLFLIGLLLVEWTIKTTLSGFERLDQGVHEIIAGNRDYEFAFKPGRKDVANSMAQSLNLMLALLLGRPLPRDEEEYMQFSEGMYSDDGAGPSPTPAAAPAPSAAQQPGAAPQAGGSADDAALAAEPADAYYKRIFEEYVAAKRAVGTPEDDLTYARFAEKVARIERRLKEQHDARGVRFHVVVEDGKVTLSPVFLD